MRRLLFAGTRLVASNSPSLWIAWAPFAPRSQRLAAALGAEIHKVHFLAYQRPLVAPLKYLFQAFVTWRLLWSKHPRVVLVQNPPIFAVMLVALYARLIRSHYIIDTHTGALVGAKWRWSVPLHRWLSRYALATLVTNARMRDQLLSGRSEQAFRVLIVEDPPAELSRPLQLATSMPGTRQVVVIATYDSDEPIEAVLNAARQLPDVSFAITGDVRRLTAAVRAICPRNVHLTGWLSDVDYASLIRGANVVVALTTRDHTTLCGAWEALYSEQPLITSDWPVLRMAFPQGAVFTGATSEEIMKSVQVAFAQEDHLRAAMRSLAARKRQTWASSIAELRQLIEASSSSS
jgi:glycosyltransferase involved in cell wall biosynthesis